MRKVYYVAHVAELGSIREKGITEDYYEQPENGVGVFTCRIEEVVREYIKYLYQNRDECDDPIQFLSMLTLLQINVPDGVVVDMHEEEPYGFIHQNVPVDWFSDTYSMVDVAERVAELDKYSNEAGVGNLALTMYKIFPVADGVSFEGAQFINDWVQPAVQRYIEACKRDNTVNRVIVFGEALDASFGRNSRLMLYVLNESGRTSLLPHPNIGLSYTVLGHDSVYNEALKEEILDGVPVYARDKKKH